MNSGWFHTQRPFARRVLSLGLVGVMLVLAACGSSDSDKDGKTEDTAKTITIGVLSPAALFAPAVQGFKDGLAEQGYVEGKNVTYIYDSTVTDVQALEVALDEMLANQNIDLFLATGTPATSLAKTKLEGKNIPVVFAPVNDPLASGLVESMVVPGGNLTGIQAPSTIGKAVEWLVKIVPSVKRIFVPHNPTDNSSVQSVTDLQKVADTLGLELVIVEASTTEEVIALSQNFPDNVDAVFLPRAGSLTNQVTRFVASANARKIPVVYAEIGSIVEDGVMIGYGSSFYEIGKQATALAVKILQGDTPAKLPVEQAETYLGINLKTAAAIGIEIPDSVLRQATQVVPNEP